LRGAKPLLPLLKGGHFLAEALKKKADDLAALADCFFRRCDLLAAVYCGCMPDVFGYSSFQN
jgi:hypothetical protein